MRWPLVCFALLAVAACDPSRWEPSRGEVPAQPELAPDPITSATSPAEAGDSARPPVPGTRLDLPLGDDELRLPAGRWVVDITVPGKRYVTIGIAGPRDALVDFEVVPPKGIVRMRTGSLDDDGRLPTFLAFHTPHGDHRVLAVIDVKAPVRVLRLSAERRRLDGDDPQAGAAEPQPLVGMPAPFEAHAGYDLWSPTRYLFVRADVAAALRASFHQTERRFDRNDIAVGDISQWNGIRPATDLDNPRHISHQYGRDIDIALPASEGPSVLKNHCRGVMNDEGRLECAPGTVHTFDAERMAYFLATLIDGPSPYGRYIPNPDARSGPFVPVEAILLDQVYIDELRKHLDALHDKRWIYRKSYEALSDDGLIRHSPWHADHVHVRFAAVPATVPKLLQFDAEPATEPDAD